ncbi:MAG: hypothetical protein AAGH76_14925 [Pseudomonadota bacterium]
MRSAISMLVTVLMTLALPDYAYSCVVPEYGEEYDTLIEVQSLEESGVFEATFPLRIGDRVLKHAQLAYYDVESQPPHKIPIDFKELRYKRSRKRGLVRISPEFRVGEQVAIRLVWDYGFWKSGTCSAVGMVVLDGSVSEQ